MSWHVSLKRLQSSRVCCTTIITSLNVLTHNSNCFVVSSIGLFVVMVLLALIVTANHLAPTVTIGHSYFGMFTPNVLHVNLVSCSTQALRRHSCLMLSVRYTSPLTGTHANDYVL